ncbi:hypothetical protein [Nonomuraea sp. NPDC003214]
MDTMTSHIVQARELVDRQAASLHRRPGRRRDACGFGEPVSTLPSWSRAGTALLDVGRRVGPAREILSRPRVAGRAAERIIAVVEEAFTALDTPPDIPPEARQVLTQLAALRTAGDV